MTQTARKNHSADTRRDTPAAAADSPVPLLRERPWSQPTALLQSLGLPTDLMPATDNSAFSHFPLRVTDSFKSRMQAGDPNDPLLRQILPTSAELDEQAGYTNDPVGDLDSIVTPGVLKKYAGRALIVVTGACAIHCRYCFRRNFPYDELALKNGSLDNAVCAIETDESISEVILSGGDPLSVGNDKLARLMSRLDKIEHLKTIRFHTRIPVVDPTRIDDKLLRIFDRSSKFLVLVLHSNHGNEIDKTTKKVVHDLSGSCGTILNQSVLLRGINDNAVTLIELSRRLFDIGALPYYLHQLDPVAGAAHFAVDDDTARDIVTEMAAALPGYLVPRLVREIPGKPAKTALL